jgi:excinuclease ABC subunit B
LVADYEPQGDQPEAIESITNCLNEGARAQTLLGVTGSGKTFTMANVIERVQKPTLVMAHNKTLAAQLYAEFKEYFPENSVEYFVSYYDYYQPEAYIASTDTYIQKDSALNEEIDKLRHSATAALFERRDVIIVASVSCIYGLGDPEDYTDLMLSLRKGMIKDRDEIIRKLVDIQYERNEIDFRRGKFRARGDVLEIFPADTDSRVIRVEFFGDEIEKLTEIDSLTGEVLGYRDHVAIFPASHYATSREKMTQAIETIRDELEEVVHDFKMEGKLIEAQRIEQRTNYDMEMLIETGFCSGVENYSRHISGRAKGSAPYTLIDYFPDDFLLIIDESHVSIPQIGGMYKGDRARKESLVNYGFRLPSAFDNRPLMFEEFEKKINQAIFVSATPAKYERENSVQIVEQIIRPTGLIDPEVVVRPVEGQIDDLIGEITNTVAAGFRVLVTTLTKKMAEDLTTYLGDFDFKVEYLHSDIDTLKRTEIIRDLRLGVFDVLIGINLLREGLDLPEVALIAILDADKEGFLRSSTSLIQTIGRAARNVHGRVIMYAARITNSMEIALSETERRRTRQRLYNEQYGITPVSIEKAVRGAIEGLKVAEDEGMADKSSDLYKYRSGAYSEEEFMSDEQLDKLIIKLTKEMKQAARNLDFEKAAALRDRIEAFRRIELER